jgi:hypothetical protein
MNWHKDIVLEVELVKRKLLHSCVLLIIHCSIVIKGDGDRAE